MQDAFKFLKENPLILGVFKDIP